MSTTETARPATSTSAKRDPVQTVLTGLKAAATKMQNQIKAGHRDVRDAQLVGCLHFAATIIEEVAKRPDAYDTEGNYLF